MKRRIFKLAEQTQDWADAGLRGIVAHDHAAKVISAKKLTLPITITVPFYEEDQNGPTADSKEYMLTFQLVQELDTRGLQGYVFLRLFLANTELTIISQVPGRQTRVS